MTALHYLVVEPWDEAAEPGDLLSVEHPEGCPKIVQYAGDDSHLDVLVENCGVGFHIDYYGISEYFVHADDPDEVDRDVVRVGPGRHEIEVWHRKYESAGSGVEYDAGVRLVGLS